MKVAGPRGGAHGAAALLGFEGAQHWQTLRPSVDGVRSKALRVCVRSCFDSEIIQGSPGPLRDCEPPLGYLAHKKPPPQDSHRASCIGLL